MVNVLIKKANKVLSVNWETLAPHVQAHIIEYGLRQKLNDAGSSATVKELGQADAAKQALAMAENVLAALVRGEVSVRGTGKTLTLEEKMTQQVIREIFKAVTGKAVAKEADQSNETLLEAIAKVKSKTPEQVMAALQPRIDAKVAAELAKPSLPEVDFDIIED